MQLLRQFIAATMPLFQLPPQLDSNAAATLWSAPCELGLRLLLIAATATIAALAAPADDDDDDDANTCEGC